MPLPHYHYNGKRYTVDYRLKQFRYCAPDSTGHPIGRIEFIDFSSEAGDQILTSMIKAGHADYSKLSL